MEELQGLFENLSPISEEAQTKFANYLEKLEIEKGTKLEQKGQVSNYLYYIVKGSARCFYIRDNRDITVSFSLEREFMTAMHSFITRRPSYETIETLEKSVLLRISHENLERCFSYFPELERSYRKILEKYYIALEEQLIFSKFKSARDRYLDLMESKPKIIQKASVGQIASYLDMTIETLSRVRSKI